MTKIKGNNFDGAYPRHMRDAKRVWNTLRLGTIVSNQVDAKISRAMNYPSAMTDDEVVKAKSAGIEVKGQYCISKLGK